MEHLILNAQEIRRSVARIAHEILERNQKSKEIVLVGIQTGGILFAHRLAHKIQEIEGVSIPVGELDITLYRDDLALRPKTLKKTDIPFDMAGHRVVLVDDVLFTGRTIRAAMDGLIDFARPQQIQLAVLIDRGHRELPIRADYIGKNLPTSHDEQVEVYLTEGGETDRVVITRKTESDGI